jgi:leucyl aminopeptidase
MMVNIPLVPRPVALLVDATCSVDADWLVVPCCEGDADEALAWYDAATGGLVAASRQSGEWTGKLFDVLALPAVGDACRARKIVLVGGGAGGEYGPGVARKLASVAAIQARARKARSIAFVHRTDPGWSAAAAWAPAEWVEAISEGLTLADFDAGRYKSGAGEAVALDASIVVPASLAEGASALSAAAARGRQVGHCVNLARDLVNEPGNILPPRVLADRARDLVSGTSLALDVLDERAVEALGMGLLSAVGRGSREPLRLIVIRHTPARPSTDHVLGLVGKGVTFDAGGISIKSADGMERMKDDMAGGAAVIAAMRAIALLDLPVKVIAVVPAAENMPGGAATRPGDVLRSGSGRTVEVINTDAEGRLLLADALWYARQQGATHLVDIATLTGACMVALGRLTAGVFGRPDSWRDRVRETAEACGEPSWPLPLVGEERDQLDSAIADTANSGGRYGGAITAALFVGEFAGGQPWAHLDVAGPAWSAEARPHMPKGPTGFGVRTLVAVARSMAAG